MKLTRALRAGNSVLDQISHEHAASLVLVFVSPRVGLGAVDIEPEPADEAAHAAAT